VNGFRVQTKDESAGYVLSSSEPQEATDPKKSIPEIGTLITIHPSSLFELSMKNLILFACILLAISGLTMKRLHAQSNTVEESEAPKKRGVRVAKVKAKADESTADKIEVYKSVDGVDLKAYIFLPKDHQPTDQRPAVVFFFGGGWTNGSPGQFVEHCKHLAARGLVGITVDYRVASRHGVKAVSCVRDAKSAIRWTRQNSTKLGIDPNRIVAAGGSAGGHLAACTGVINGFDEPSEDNSISSRPNAIALFNPALVLAEIDGEARRDKERIAALPERFGVEPKELSPFHHVAASQPPTIIFHGIADTTVPYKTAEKFTVAMKAAGNDCELIGYPGQPHGFFNYGRGDGTSYEDTIDKLDRFLQRLGYLGK